MRGHTELRINTPYVRLVCVQRTHAHESKTAAVCIRVASGHNMAATEVFRFQDDASGTAPPTAEPLGGWQQLGARTPARLRDRLIELFRSRQNINYLRGVFQARVPPGPLRMFALDTLEDSVYSYEQGEDLIYSDPIAQRGNARPAANLWGELRRLNLAYFEYRMQFLRDKAALIAGRSSDGQWDDDEPYHYRMFVADSLRPPGHEHLNGTGPLYGIREDQTVAAEPRWPPGATYARREGFSATGARSTDPAPLPVDPAVDPDDWGWDSGNPNRTPEQAVAEYWGEDHVESSTLGATEVGGEAYIDRYGQGSLWRENTGTRFMRYPTIPIWQDLSRGRNYDREIEETLGTGSRELDNHVRRWNLDRMRKPRGEEYRRYGWRNSSTV